VYVYVYIYIYICSVWGKPLGVCARYLLPHSGQVKVSCVYVLLFFHVLICKLRCNGMLVLSTTITLDCLDSKSLVHSASKSTWKE